MLKYVASSPAYHAGGKDMAKCTEIMQNHERILQDTPMVCHSAFVKIAAQLRFTAREQQEAEEEGVRQRACISTFCGVMLQYRCTQTLAVDIHPAATIGKGVLLDHGTGLVIGETAIVGNNVSILHNVTLGGASTMHDSDFEPHDSYAAALSVLIV